VPSSRTTTITGPETLRAYDRWATHYDQDENPMVAATGWRLTTHALRVHNARVVELGCGTGRHAAQMLSAGATAYTGVDGSPGMLAHARKRLESREDAARCTWVEAELNQLPALRGPAYDVALIVLVIEHLNDLIGPLSALARWLRPGAVLRMLELHPDRIAAGTVAHFHADGVEQRFASVAHPVPQLVAALGRAGFIVDALEELVADDSLIAVAPRLAKHRDQNVVLDVIAHLGSAAEAILVR
jgi:ubiquinone/menaquinone biosynthesis C-methylase UbiE